MKKTDEQLLNTLREEFDKSAESAKVPLRLQKESIVSMLKSEQTRENINTDFSDKTDTKDKKNNIVILRRLTATAAMLAIVIAGVLATRPAEVKITKVDSFYENNIAANQIKNFRDDREIGDTINRILGRGNTQASSPEVQESSASQQSPLPSVTQSSAVSLSAPTTAQPSSEAAYIGGYENLVAVRESGSNAGIHGTQYTFSNSISVSDIGSYEADIVKKDGDYLYILTYATKQQTGGTIEQIKIVKAVPAEEMQVVSTVTLSEYSSSQTVDECIEIHVKNGKLIALINRCDSVSGADSTVAVFYDVSKPEAPVKIREHIQDGTYIYSNLQENNLCLVTDKSVTEAAENSQVIPSYTVDGTAYTLDAQKEIFMVNDPDSTYIFITVTDISDFSTPVGRFAILGSGKKLHFSSDSISFAREFVSVDADKNGSRESKTEISRFNIEGTSVVFAGSSMVNGSLIGGLSVDEESGNLRAITAGNESSDIYVYGKNMEPISGSSITHKGEKAIGGMFIGSNGYIVVSGKDGEKTMIIDLSDPKNPKTASKISTEDFAESMHMISDSLILGTNSEEVFIEKEIIDENGNVKTVEEESRLISFSLFDVSNPDNPSLSSTYTLDLNHTLLSAKNGKGIIVIPDKKMFGIPVKIYDSESQTETSAYMIFDVSDGNFDNIGYFSHSETVTGSSASRSAYDNGVLYTVSGEKIVAFSIDDGSVIATKNIN